MEVESSAGAAKPPGGEYEQGFETRSSPLIPFLAGASLIILSPLGQTVWPVLRIFSSEMKIERHRGAEACCSGESLRTPPNGPVWGSGRRSSFGGNSVSVGSASACPGG